MSINTKTLELEIYQSMNTPKTAQMKQSTEIIQNFLRPIVRKWLDAIRNGGDWNHRCCGCWSATFVDKGLCTSCERNQDEEPKCIMCGDDAMMDGSFCTRACLRAYNRGD